MSNNPIDTIIAPEEVEEARDAGLGILTDAAATQEGFTREVIIELLTTILTLELSGMPKRELDKVRVEDIARAIDSARRAPMHVLRGRLYALLDAKRELVMLALNVNQKKLTRNKKTGELQFTDLPPETAFGRPVVLEELDDL